jgi:hypothetical protein
MVPWYQIRSVQNSWWLCLLPTFLGGLCRHNCRDHGSFICYQMLQNDTILLWYSRRYHSTFWYVPRGACTPYCKKAILDENVKLATTVYPPWSGHNFLFTCYMPALPKSRSPRCGKICWSLHTFYYGFRPIVYNYVQDIPGRNHSFAPSYWYLWQYYWLPPHYLLWCQLGTPGHFPSISLKHPTSNHRGVKINLWAPILLQWLSNSVEDT